MSTRKMIDANELKKKGSIDDCHIYEIEETPYHFSEDDEYDYLRQINRKCKLGSKGGKKFYDNCPNCEANELWVYTQGLPTDSALWAMHTLTDKGRGLQ